MKQLKLIAIIFLLAITKVLAQEEKKIPVLFSLIDNSTSLPGRDNRGLYTSPHMGFTVGTYHNYKSTEKHDFFQNYKFGFFYHQLSQFALQFYSEVGYRRKFKSGLDIEGMAGAGYLHAFPDLQQFVLENGKYVKKKSFGRPEFMATASVGVGYNFSKNKHRIFLQYQFWVQAPFVKNYVPVLPNTAIQLGIRFYIKKKSRQ